MAILYISLTIDLAFVFKWFFILFLGLQQCTTFLLFDIGCWYLACLFINLFEITVHGYFLPVTLTFDPKVKLLTVIWKYCILLITFFLFEFRLNFWHVARLNQVNLPYAIICDLDLLLQGQVIYNLKNKIFYFLTCFSVCAGLLHQ
jgi:hypothetical protein